MALAIKLVDAGDVIDTHYLGISKLQIWVAFGNNGRFAIPGESFVGVFHYRVEVIRGPQVISFLLYEIFLLFRFDVLEQYLHIVIPIRADLLMVEAQSMKELMLHSTIGNTSCIPFQ